MATLEQDVLALDTARGRALRKIQWFAQNVSGQQFTSGTKTVTLDSVQMNGDILDLYVALDVAGNPMGLGPGNVRFERIRIPNPPIMIVTGYDVDGNPIRQLAPLQAIKDVIIHTLKLIVTGRRPDSLDSYGHTTLVVYPEAGGGGGNVTCDGVVNRSSVNEVFASIIAGAGTTGFSATGTTINTQQVSSSTSNQYQTSQRGIYTFDTSTLTASAIITQSTLSLYGSAKVNTLGSPDLHVCASTPAAANNIAQADYSQLGSTSFGSVTYANFSTSAYNDITLDANGIANISLTSVSKFGSRTSWDITATPPTWSSSTAGRLVVVAADTAGTSSDPKLTVVYSIPTTSITYPMAQAKKILGRRR